MSEYKIGVVGIGSLRHGPSVLGSLTSYFGERPLEVRLWDADLERLELFGLLARSMCTITQNEMVIDGFESLDEALMATDAVIMCLDAYCLGKLGAKADALPGKVLGFPNPGAAILKLVQGYDMLPGTEALDWCPELDPFEAAALPHQILRWVHLEESPVTAFERAKNGPIHPWLNAEMQKLRARNTL